MLRTLSLVLVLSSPALAGSLASPVVGGTAVPAGEWPDVVAVLAANAACSGTLIAPDVVLTAGHCIETQPRVVVIGSTDFAHPTGEVIRVKSATAYPAWETHYDVGVVMLEHAASVKPRAIASACTVRDHLVAGAKVHVVGFGLTTPSGTGTNTSLHEALLPVVDATCAHDAACAPTIAPGGEFTAGGHGTDACFGDSGGPIYLDDEQGPVLVGVVSRGLEVAGEPCGGGGVYVRADKVVPWIERVTGRTLDRAPCDRPADEEGEAPEDGGGCTVGGGTLGAGTLVVIALLWILTSPRRLEAREK